MDSWHTSSVETRQSALILRRFGVHGAFLEWLCSNWCSSLIQMGVSRNPWSCLKEVNPLVVYDVESGMALEPLQGNMASFPLDLAYTCLFRVRAVTSVSF